MNEEQRTDPVEQRIKEIDSALRSAKTPAHIRKLLKGTIRNVASLEVKLEEERLRMPSEDLLKEYDNGGGQKGTQKNPFWKAYEDVFRDFNTGMDKIIAMLPEGAREPLIRKVKEADKPRSTLEALRQKQGTE